MSKITHIRSRRIIDCGEEVGKVINAALRADFTLNSDGSFDLVPWDGGLSGAGEIFRAATHGRRFANIESAISIIMDTQLEQLELSTVATGAWIYHMIAARCALVEALGGELRNLAPRSSKFSARSVHAALPLLPYCIHPISSESPNCIILNRYYKPLGIANYGASGFVEYEDFISSHISLGDPALPQIIAGMKKSQHFGGEQPVYYFFDDATSPVDKERATKLLSTVERVLDIAKPDWRK